MYSNSPNIKSNQLFYIKSSEIEDRIDPYYYKKEFKELIKELKNNPLTKTLKSLNIYIKKGVFDMRPDRYTDKGIPFLRVADITYEGMDFSSTVFINERTHQQEIKTEFLPGDIVIAKIGHTIGKISILPNDFEKYNISQNVVGIKISDEVRKILNPEYLKVFLSSRLGKKQIIRHSSQGAQPKITLDSLRKIILPLFSLKIQKQIVESYFNALNNKKRKEKEAKLILESIDKYLLKELQINLPTKDNSLKNRVFNIKYSDVSGARLDSDFNQTFYSFLKNPKSIYPNEKIGKLSVEIKTGLPIRKDFRVNDGEFPYYGANGIIGYMDEYTHDGKYLVVGQDGYIGNHFVVDGKFWGSNHNWVLKLKNNYNYHYVKFVLDVLDYSYLITGGVIPKLTKSSLQSILIPIPPIEKQNEIANHILSLRKKAEELRLDAKSVLKEAESKIEKIIIG